MGKAYANRKKEIDRPESDFYQTPRPLTWELIKLRLFDFDKLCYEPACGKLAIVKELEKYFSNLHYTDINHDLYYQDFLELKNYKCDYIITNPPFSLFDDFVIKAKEVATDKIAFIGKTNFFGAEKRNRIGIWKNLKYVFVFNRQVDYRFFREDNKMQSGNLISAWFIWDMNWKENYWMTSIIDVQKYMLSNKIIEGE